MLSPDAFRRRFTVARFADGGVIVDTVSGTYFRLNASAATVCQILESTATAADATRQVAREFKLVEEAAREQIRSITAALAARSPSKPSNAPTEYRPSPDGGYELCFEGRPILHVDAEGQQLTLVGRLESPVFKIHDLLRNLAPRIAFLRGLIVLHGSAVMEGDSVVAMCGVSEAGKTTTARLLSRYGRELVAEDLVVASASQSEIRIFTNGERHLNSWAAATAESFELDEAHVASTASLLTIENGLTKHLESIWFMDASRRTDGDSIRRKSLPPTEALLAVLSNSFVGGADWRRFLDMGRRVVAATRAYEIAVPNTVTRLEDAIAHQRVNSAS